MNKVSEENKPLIDPENYVAENGQFEMTKYLKDQHINMLESIDVAEIKKNANMKDTVTLFHGTTTAHLNNILQNGLLPRKETNNDNWKDVGSSADNVIYLTNKWHYFYAYQASDAWMKEKHPLQEDERPNVWFDTWETFPCYIECEVPKALLVADEDFYHSRYVSQKIKAAVKKNQNSIHLDWQESLAHYATAGVLGGVPVEFIKSFSVLGELKLYQELMFSASPYQKDLMKWSQGKGKGDVKLLDIQKREDKSLLNGAWFMGRDVKAGQRIGQIGINQKSGSIALSLERK